MDKVKPKIVETDYGTYNIEIDDIAIGFISYETGRFVVSRYWTSLVGLELNVGERFVGTKPVRKEYRNGDQEEKGI